MFPNIPISSASQHDLQAILDQRQYDHLFQSREHAHLHALAHSSGTKFFGWLTAIPQPSLGLAIPGPEFVVGLGLWLGVSLFPPSPLCTCLFSIDYFGDHLLGCSHGPMRIHRHDALVSILHHALLQDHPGALKEQHASFDDDSRPGDTFIQIFRMVVQPILMSLSAVLLSPLIYPPLLRVLGWLLQTLK